MDSHLRGRHVAMVLSALGAGGAERVVADLSRRWVAEGARVTIFAFDRPDDPVYHAFDPAVELVRLAIPSSGIHSVPIRLLALRRAIRQARPDVLISFLTKINVTALLAMTGIDAPVIVSERNNPDQQRKSILWRLFSQLAHLRADAVVCQTARSKRCVPVAARRRAVVIPNSIAPASVQPVPSGRKRLVAVGRLTEQKGFELLIQAFGRVAGNNPGWDLHIWGDGPDRPVLEAAIRDLGLGSRIYLRGLSTTPGGWRTEADAFVLSSRYEGFPNVLGEAMAAGLPVISVDCDFGPADMIIPWENGLLVPPGQVALLADGIERLLSDRPLQHALRQAAPAIARRFAPEQVEAAWRDLLQAVLATRASPRPSLRASRV